MCRGCAALVPLVRHYNTNLSGRTTHGMTASNLQEVEIKSIRNMLTGAQLLAPCSGQHMLLDVQPITSFWMCKVRSWRWLFGDRMQMSLDRRYMR